MRLPLHVKLVSSSVTMIENTAILNVPDYCNSTPKRAQRIDLSMSRAGFDQHMLLS